MKTGEPWLNWAIELQSLAQTGLHYSKDVFDQERYQRIRDIAAEMIAHQAQIPLPKVQRLFCCETGYQTPKLDTRAAIFQGDTILLVHENEGTWSLPGGWVDTWLSIAENTVKEVREEAGLTVTPRRVIAVQDRKRHNQPVYAWGIIKVFMECDLLGGQFVPNSETTETGWFSLADLPPLAQEKVTREQIALCFQAHEARYWETRFD